MTTVSINTHIPVTPVPNATLLRTGQRSTLMMPGRYYTLFESEMLTQRTQVKVNVSSTILHGTLTLFLTRSVTPLASEVAHRHTFDAQTLSQQLTISIPSMYRLMGSVSHSTLITVTPIEETS